MLEWLLLALFSDVHGNVAALRAVLAHLDRVGPDRVWALGDLVGRGPEPELVVRELETRGIPSLRGNWDEWVAGRSGWENRPKRQAWIIAARRLMKPRSLARLVDAPEREHLHLEGRTVLLCHGSPRDPIELLMPETSDEELAAALSGVEADVVAVGHSHRPFVRRVGRTLVVNTGTVGYPFNGDPRPSLALVHFGEQVTAEIVRVPYPIEENLRAMRHLVEAKQLDQRLELRYERALLGEGPEPHARLLGSDRGSEALVKLLARRARSVYEVGRLERALESEDGVRVLRMAVRALREALVLARPMLPARGLDRALERLTLLGNVLGKRRQAGVLAAALADPELTGEDAGSPLVDRLTELTEIRKRRMSARLHDTYTDARRLRHGLDVLGLAMSSATEDGPDVTTCARELLHFRLQRVKELLLALVDPTGRAPGDLGVHHELRIQLRRMAHGAHLLAEAHPSMGLEALEGRAKAAHRGLGRLNDALDLARFLESGRVTRIARGRSEVLDRLRARVRLRVAKLEAEARAGVTAEAGDLVGLVERILHELR